MERAQIIGNISAKNIFISGIVHGNINSDVALQITPNAKLHGDVFTSNFGRKYF